LLNFYEFIKTNKVIVTEGAQLERVIRAQNVTLDPYIGHSGFIYHTPYRKTLEGIYRSYLDAGCKYHSPFIVLAPTWRASRDRLKSSHIPDKINLNQDNVSFLKKIVSSYGTYSKQVKTGGLMACSGDSYRPEEALTMDEAMDYHSWQAYELDNCDIDFIKVATLPAYTEAAGMASVLSQLTKPYILSFVVKKTGDILDGTPLDTVVNRIDSLVKKPPVCYMVNCVYPDHFSQAMDVLVKRDESAARRIFGLQANTSARSHDELDGMHETETEKPDEFALKMMNLYRRFNVKILGGCCGTDDTHIEKIAEHVSKLSSVY